MRCGLLGERLGHSFSKQIHEQLGEYSYSLFEVERERLGAFMQRRDFDGINVTIPYKTAVMPYLDEIDEAAREIGCVNTVLNRGGRLLGFNTDFAGMRRLLLRNGFELEGKTAAVLGTGGTSKTARAVLKSLGASEIITVGRKSAVNYDNLEQYAGRAQYVINTTPCGMYPDTEQCPVDIGRFSRLEGVADVIYNPLRTRLVQSAQEMGLKSCGGLYMLVAQAFYAGERFLGRKLDEQLLEDVYKSILTKKQSIVLIGMPACGKTTIARALSERLGLEAVDTDELIEKREGMSISEIFAKRGEEYFRSAESEVIKALGEKNGVIIATGGGAVLRDENVRQLKKNGRLFFLDRPLEQLVPTSDRPLAGDRRKIERLYHERYKTYCAVCDDRVNADGVVSHAVSEITSRLGVAAE